MSKKKSTEKIVVPTDEEVQRFGKDGASEQTGTEAADRESGERQPAAGAQPPPEDPVQLRDKLLRARAELANLQRRAANEKTEAIRYAVADFARDLLEVVDDFERMFEAASSEASEGSITEGSRLVYENLLKVLKIHHIERIEAEGKPFDPAQHEAVMQQPDGDQPPNTVLREVQKGYRLQGRLLRPAKVIVSAEPAERGVQEHGEDNIESKSKSP
jgi:molecular chaperone GrpE